MTSPETPGRRQAAEQDTATASGSVADPPRTQTPSRRRLGCLVLLTLAVAGLIGGAWYILTRQPEEETQLVLQGNIDVRQVNLAFKVDGRIESLTVDEGDSVKAGQVVATLDKRYFDDDLRLARAGRANVAANLSRLENGSRPQEIAQARALVQERKTALEVEKRIYPRMEQLLKIQGVSQDDVDREKATLEEADARLKQAQESLRLTVLGPRQEDIEAARAQLAQQDATIIQIERRLADCYLVAPSDGTILTRARERGAIVQPGETVFTLTLISPVWVRTYVNEVDLGLIEPGMQASVTTDTAPNRPYSGHIGFISPTAEFTPKTVETRELRTSLVYRLRVLVDNPDGGLRQGMPVTVSLPLPHPRRKETLWERLRQYLPALNASKTGGGK